MSTEPQESHWSMDKRVNVSVVLTLGIQIIVIIWGASAMWTQVQALEARVAQIEAMKISERVGRIEEQIRGQGSQLDRIENKLDRITGYPAKP